MFTRPHGLIRAGPTALNTNLPRGLTHAAQWRTECGRAAIIIAACANVALDFLRDAVRQLVLDFVCFSHNNIQLCTRPQILFATIVLSCSSSNQNAVPAAAAAVAMDAGFNLSAHFLPRGWVRAAAHWSEKLYSRWLTERVSSGLNHVLAQFATSFPAGFVFWHNFCGCISQSADCIQSPASAICGSLGNNNE